MYNWFTTEVATSLIRQFVSDPTKFLGMTRFCPVDVVSQMNSEVIKYQILGPIIGMTQPYQLGTQPKLVKPQVLSEKTQGTAYWRDEHRIDEQDILRIAAFGKDRRQLAAERLAVMRLAQLNVMIDTRIEWLVWAALNNALTAFNSDGIEFSIDYGLPSVDDVSNWGDAAGGSPIADMQEALLDFKGSGVSSIDIVMNPVTASYLAKSEDLLDRVNGTALVSMMGVQSVPGVFQNLVQGGDGTNMTGPKINSITVYNKGYWSDPNTFNYFVPNDRVFLLGSGGPEYAEEGGPSDRGTPGLFLSTPAIHDSAFDLRPGKYVSTVDNTKSSPKHVLMEGGIHGLPAIKRPTWVRRLAVGA